MPHGPITVVRERVRLDVELPHGVVLDVPDVVPELPEATQPVQVEPRLSTERIRAHHSEDDEAEALAQRRLWTIAAGLPATTDPDGTAKSTTAPAATTESSPMSAPSSKTERVQIHTLSPIRT